MFLLIPQQSRTHTIYKSSMTVKKDSLDPLPARINISDKSPPFIRIVNLKILRFLYIMEEERFLKQRREKSHEDAWN